MPQSTPPKRHTRMFLCYCTTSLNFHPRLTPSLTSSSSESCSQRNITLTATGQRSFLKMFIIQNERKTRRQPVVVENSRLNPDDMIKRRIINSILLPGGWTRKIDKLFTPKEKMSPCSFPLKDFPFSKMKNLYFYTFYTYLLSALITTPPPRKTHIRLNDFIKILPANYLNWEIVFYPR